MNERARSTIDPGSGASAHRALAPGRRTLTAALPGRAIQRREARMPSGTRELELDAPDTARRGLAGATQPLPHLDSIRASFGADHDLDRIPVGIGGAAAEACDDLGARAYAHAGAIAFARTPDLHTAAHEAAHVVQQRSGAPLASGLGQVGDPYERHADAVADAVVAGRSASDLLAPFAASTAIASDGPIQCLVDEHAKVDTKARYWHQGFPVILRGVDAKEVELQYANGSRAHAPLAAVDEDEAKDAALAWDKAWTAMKAPSAFAPGSTEATADGERDKLAAMLESLSAKLAHAQDAATLDQQATTARALAAIYAADKEFVYAAALYAFARTSLIAAQRVRGATEKPPGLDELETKLAEVELAFLADTVIGHEGGDPAQRANANAARRAQLAEIRASFTERHAELAAAHRDEFATAATEKSPALASDQTYTQDVARLGKALAFSTDTFLRGMFVECEQQLGPPPCTYAAFALGSLARQDQTPNSDFEWAIVLNDQDYGNDNVAYFHALARLLYIKVLALGETIVPAVGAPELVNVFDDTTKAGLSFDGMLDRGCKVPMTPSHHHRYVAKEPEILNPALTLAAESGARAVQDPRYDGGANTKTLATVVTSYRCIHGDPKGAITARYRAAMHDALGDKASGAPRHRMLGRRKLAEAHTEWPVSKSLATKDKILVKKEMYRQVDILCDGLRLYYGLDDVASPWETLDRLPALATADGWDASTCAKARIALAIAVDERWKAAVESGSGYGRLTPDDDDRAKIAVYLEAMTGVSTTLAAFLETHPT